MDNKTMLELAAKAAGVNAYWSVDDSIQQHPVFVTSCGGGMGTMPYEEEWNPLKKDADALRLAVKLEMDVCFGANYVIVRGSVQVPTVNNANDPCAATRRAITRAAAAIGEAMQ